LLLTIVTNEARNRRRSAGRRAKLNLQVAAEGRQVVSAPVSPEAAVVAAERREELLANLLANLGRLN
jgi:DNA-directed RNA polymerase specialized sigma24 family protein